MINLDFPHKFEGLFQPYSYKVFYGGRGGAKSWSFAQAAVIDAYTHNHLWLCTREFQSSIKDSVYQTIVDMIKHLGLEKWFQVTKAEIRCLLTGSRFIFKGLHHNIMEIKSLEGVDRCWVEEAQNMSKLSLKVLLPTIRKKGSEIWFSFNPYEETDAVYDYFIRRPPPEDSIVVKVGWEDNPYFSNTRLEAERLHMLRTDPEGYAWVWGGNCRTMDETTIFRNVKVIGFDSPPINIPRERTLWRFGADWGFSKDPSTLVRTFIKDNDLYVDEEWYGENVEIEDIPNGWRKIEGAENHLIFADNSRPETISHMRRRGFRVRPCTKWQGSLEDGIAYMKKFDNIYVHPRCKHTAQEFRLYRWKVTKTDEEITRKPEDKDNHCIDAIRYSLDAEITHKRRNLDIDPHVADYLLRAI